ncbi:uroporphyrinogen-III synthase [Algirhabdus cladophorae]
MTRPAEDAARFLDMLDGDFDAQVSPVFTVRFHENKLDFTPDEALIFTSTYGVDALTDDLTDRAAFCVGQKTLDHAIARGCNATRGDGDADALIRHIMSQTKFTKFVHIRGQHTVGNIAGRLTGQGCPTSEVIAYDQVENPIPENLQETIEGRPGVIFPVFSARSAHILCKWLVDFTVSPRFIAISPTVQAVILQSGLGPVTLAEAPNALAMANAVSLELATSREVE